MTTLEQVKTKTKSHIIALWATHRGVSTAFEKTFSQRSDTQIIHEPFCDVYYFSKWRISDQYGDQKEVENCSSSDVINRIFTSSSPLVFIKDHAYEVLPYVDEEFIASVTNTFLIRNPREVMNSWYKINEYPTEESFGFTGLETMWEIVVEKLGHKPVVVEATRFRQDPEKILQLYCENIGIEFDRNMLGWQDGKLQNWNEREAKLHEKWHSTLDQSKGIMPPKQETITIRPQELPMVEKAEKIYNKLLQFAL